MPLLASADLAVVRDDGFPDMPFCLSICHPARFCVHSERWISRDSPTTWCWVGGTGVRSLRPLNKKRWYKPSGGLAARSEVPSDDELRIWGFDDNKATQHRCIRQRNQRPGRERKRAGAGQENLNTKPTRREQPNGRSRLRKDRCKTRPPRRIAWRGSWGRHDCADIDGAGQLGGAVARQLGSRTRGWARTPMSCTGRAACDDRHGGLSDGAVDARRKGSCRASSAKSRRKQPTSLRTLGLPTSCGAADSLGRRQSRCLDAGESDRRVGMPRWPSWQRQGIGAK